MWSQMILQAPVSGTARISPIAPHSHPQNSSAKGNRQGIQLQALAQDLGIKHVHTDQVQSENGANDKQRSCRR